MAGTDRQGAAADDGNRVMTLVSQAAAQAATANLTHEPMWVLRVNPLRRSRLADRALRTLVDELAAAERRVHELSRRCRDDLHDLIGVTDDHDRRKELVDARRRINDDKVPRGAVMSLPVVALWLALRAQRDELRVRVAGGFDLAATRERAVFGEMLADENFRRSLSAVAPEVDREAERYLAALTAGGPIPNRTRKSERGLLQYVTRAMTRTSPLLRFTAVGLAVPAAGGRSLASAPREVLAGAVAFSGLDLAMLTYVVGGMRPPEGADLLDAWVGLAPTAQHDPTAESVYFLRRTAQGYRRMAVKATGVVAVLVQATVMGPRSVRAVIAQVQSTTEHSADEAAGLVLSACRQGILCTYSEPEDSSVGLTTLLKREGRGEELLRQVASELLELPDTPAPERAGRIAIIDVATSALSETVERPARVLVEEDFVLPPVQIETADQRDALLDVGSTVEMLSMFDWLHDARMLLHRAFVDRFGPGANVALVEHAQGLMHEVTIRAERIGRTTESADVAAMRDLGTRDGALAGLHALRVGISREVASRIGDGVNQCQEEVRIERADVVDLLADVPARVRRDPLTYAVFVQHGGGRLVFNDGLPGHGMLYSRFLDADSRLGGDAIAGLSRQVMERFGYDERHLVEDRGLHRLNVNAHPRILPEGLLADDWFDLRLVHDPVSDTLGVEDADGRPLRILALGTGHPGLFPAALSVATCLSTGGRLNNDFHDVWRAAADWDGKQTKTVPRLAVGDFVLSRRRWYGGTELTAATVASTDGERLAALTHWRTRHDVPDEVFLKTSDSAVLARPLEASDAMPRSSRHKPQYVDLSSALATSVLPRMVARREVGPGDFAYVEEALPGVVDDTHATEWAVEIGRNPGGLFEYQGSNT